MRSPESRRREIQRKRQHYRENKERILEQQRLARVRNPDRNAEKCARWRGENPDAWARWSAEHPEYNKLRHTNNKERELARGKRWAEQNRARRADVESKRRAKKIQGQAEEIDRQTVLDAYGGLCGICGHSVPADFHLDHMVPLSKGGLHVYGNVQPAHANCNLAKSANWPRIAELEARGTQFLSQGQLVQLEDSIATA
jgi:hypothetical protein